MKTKPRLFHLLIVLMLLLPACGSRVTPTPAGAGDITFTAERTDLRPGECTTLHWQVQGGFGVYLDDQPVERNGQREVCPIETLTYTLGADMGDHMERCQVEIRVKGAAQDGSTVTPVVTIAVPPTSASGPAYQAGKWFYTGGPRGGLGYDVRMDARLPGIVYVTDSHGGEFMSTDDGLSYFAINNGITARAGASGDLIPVFSLTIDPHDPLVLWLGTQFTGNIFKSTDGGKTWMEKDNGVASDRTLSFRGFTVDPHSPQIVYAMAEIASWGWTPDRSERKGRSFDITKGIVYKSTDGGESWQAIWEGDNLTRYLWIDPRDSNVLYVSTGFFDREAANSNIEAKEPGGVGILKSTDGGKRWRVLDQKNGLTGLFITSLFMKPDEPDVLLAAAGTMPWVDQRDSTGQGGIYLTKDGGETWNKVVDPYTRSELPPDYHFMTTVEYCLSDPNIAYADGMAGFYRSTDGGNTWTMLPAQFPAGVRKGVSIDMMCDPVDPNRLFINFYAGGNALTEDGGQTFIDSSHGYSGAQVRGLVVDPGQPAHIYTALKDGVWSSYDGGDHWTGLANGAGAVVAFTGLAVDPGDPNHLTAISEGDGILIETRDAGKMWNQVAGTRRQASPDAPAQFSEVVFAPSNPSRVYAGVVGGSSGATTDPTQPRLFASDDGGQTWQERFPGSTEAVMALAVHPRNAEIVLAANGHGQILKSSDGGRTWAASDEGLWTNAAGDSGSGRHVTVLTFDPLQPDRVLAGTDVGAVFQSTDGGAHWQRLDTGLPAQGTVKAIVTTGDGNWFLGTKENGAFQLAAGENAWRQINEGLMLREINELAISSDGRHLYAATEGMGVFRLDLNGQPPVPAATPEAAAPTQAESQPVPAATGIQTEATQTPKPAGGLPCGSAAIIPLGIILFMQWRRKSMK